MTILYLYSELVGYQVSIFKEYVSAYNAQVHVVSWDKKKIKPYSPPPVDGVSYYKRSEFKKETLLQFVLELKPDIIYVVGWMDDAYLYVTRRMKKQRIPVVIGFDDMWIGSLRQRIGALIFPYYYKKYFTHAWVAGAYQFEFAKKVGFKNNEIIFDLLSADTSVFKYDARLMNDDQPVPKAFLYTGNFRHVKGFDILIKAFDIYRNKLQGEWKLICVGNGEFESLARNMNGVEVYPFLSSDELVKISTQAGVFVLPSRKDQWGVVIHEFCCLGMPILLSESVGARSAFFINGYNGLMFFNDSAEELADKMLEFANMNTEDLRKMSSNSIFLSKKISIASSAANFMSLIR